MLKLSTRYIDILCDNWYIHNKEMLSISKIGFVMYLVMIYEKHLVSIPLLFL